MSKIDILNSLNVPSQLPLNAKGYVLTLAELRDLGENNIKAFTYYEDMTIHCVESHETFIWKEVLPSDKVENKLLDADFTYPANSIANGIDYSGRSFNLYILQTTSSGGGDGFENPDGSYTWQVFADDILGNNISIVQLDTSNFAGFAYNQTEKAINISDPSIFLFIPLTSVPGRDGIDGANGIDGLDGDRGIQGPPGLDGNPVYFHIAYADDEDGNGFSFQPFNKKYIGTYSDYSPQSSNNPANYVWMLGAGADGIDGSDGTKGIPGINGIDGLTYYLHIAYATASDGSTGFSVDDSIDKTYIGTYVDLVEADSLDHTVYDWSQIKAPLEGGGIDDGNGTFTWIKYSMSNDGASPLSDSSVGMRYMGIALEQATKEESNDYRDYEWHLINVEGDVDGINQNNFVRVVPVYVSDLEAVTEEAIAGWVNNRGISVLEDENILFDIQESSVIIEDLVLDPDIPLNLVATIVDSSTVDFAWIDTDPATTNYILKNTKVSTNETTYHPLTDKVLQLTGLDSGEDYVAIVEAYDSSGNVKESNQVSYTLFTDVITPTLFVEEVTDTTVKLRWDIDASFNHDRFELYQVGVGKIFDTPLPTWGGTTVVGLTPETTYQFYVIAYEGANASTQSATVSATTLATVLPPLTAPVISLLYATSDTVKFDIVVPPLEINRIGSFKVFYRIKGLTEWVERIVNTDLTQTFGGLELDTNYELKIQSIENNGVTVSPDSNIIEFDTIADTGLTLIAIPDLSTPTTSDVRIVGGQPFQVLSISISALLSYNGSGWTANSYLKNLAVNSPMLASIGSTLPTEFHEITLDANGEWADRYIIGTTYDNEADIPAILAQTPGFSYRGKISFYDFTKTPSFGQSVTINAPF